MSRDGSLVKIHRPKKVWLFFWWLVSTHLKNMRKSNWIISPNRDENKTYLKPPPRFVVFPVDFFPSPRIRPPKFRLDGRLQIHGANLAIWKNLWRDSNPWQPLGKTLLKGKLLVGYM